MNNQQSIAKYNQPTHKKSLRTNQQAFNVVASGTRPLKDVPIDCEVAHRSSSHFGDFTATSIQIATFSHLLTSFPVRLIRRDALFCPKRRATPRADVTKLGKYGMRLRPAHKAKQHIGHQGDLASNQDDERQLIISPYLNQAGGKPNRIFMDRVSLRSNDNYCLKTRK